MQPNPNPNRLGDGRVSSTIFYVCTGCLCVTAVGLIIWLAILTSSLSHISHELDALASAGGAVAAGVGTVGGLAAAARQQQNAQKASIKSVSTSGAIRRNSVLSNAGSKKAAAAAKANDDVISQWKSVKKGGKK